MFEINERVIRNYTNEVTYKRGETYYLKEKVHDMDVHNILDKRRNLEITIITAEVESSYDWNYDVEVQFSDELGFMHLDCDCDAFNGGFSGSRMCKHITATLIKYCREKNKLLNKSNTSKVDTIIEMLQRTSGDMTELKTPLNLEISFQYEARGERAYSVEMRIGESKLYVIKNMRDFLENINKVEQIEFGKGFTFNPFHHYFEETDQRLIELLMEIYELDVVASNYSYTKFYGGNSTIKFFSGKKAYLTEMQAKRFLKGMKDRTLNTLEINGLYYNNVNIIEEDLPLEFDIKLNKQNMILKPLNEQPPVPITKDGEYFFYNNIIYKPSKEQLRVYVPFHNGIAEDKNHSMTFTMNDSEKIASYIVPGLKKISKSVNIDKNLEDNFYEEPLKVSIFFDKENDNATATIKFIYGDLEINPLKDSGRRTDKRILIRDVEEETKIANILESFGFKRDSERYILEDEEMLVDFISQGMAKLQEIGEVYYSEAFKSIKVYNHSSMKSSIKLNDNDLLEFSFKIEGVDKEELKDIFLALKEKKKYYRLKKGGFVSLDSSEFSDVGSLIEYLDIKDSDLENEKILLSKYNALYIDQNLKQNNMVFIERNKKFRELVNNIKDIQEMDYSLPEHLDKVMRNYQKVGFKWFKTLAVCGFGGIMADEMGLGKTLQTIAFIAAESLENVEERKPSLVVAPTSLVYNWKNEVEKFSPELKVLVVSGNKNEREEQRKELEEADLVITSYPLIRRDIDEYRNMEFKYCFLDEAQQIKNPNSINAKSVKEIKAKGYFALTGTPIENSLTELWSIFDFIMPGYLMNHNKFSQKYELPVVRDKDKKALEELNKHIKPFILRRLKKDVIKELPPKIEHKVVVEMTEEQKKVYMTYISAVKNEIDELIRDKGFNKSKLQILSALTRLRQICCEPSVFIENFEGESGKMLALEDILSESIGGGHRILLFSQFTSVLKNIAKRLDNNKVQYMYLDGKTKSELRGDMVKEFNEGKSDVFLISLKAGGTGLNLTGADIVIHFDPWWNPAVEDQATDRAHRIGQKKTVEVIKLIARGTIEEKISDLQDKKKEIIKNVIDSDMNEEDLVSQMTQDELESLFR